MRATTAAVTLASATWVAAATPVAHAGQCGKPDLVDMVPSDGATGVPVNATLGAHYTASAEHLGERVMLQRLPNGPKQVLTPTWQAAEQLLSVTPAAPLEPGVDYLIQWPALRGLNAAAPGVGGTAMFTTGTATDGADPSFAGVVGLSWDLERAPDDCVDGLVERFVFDVTLAPASDDGGTSGLTLMLFQTKGPNVFGMPVPIPARAWPEGGMEGTRAQVKLPTVDAVGEICFAGLVRATLGDLPDGVAVQACVHTTDPPFFNGCSVSGGDGAPGGVLASLLPLAALLLRRRMRART